MPNFCDGAMCFILQETYQKASSSVLTEGRLYFPFLLSPNKGNEQIIGLVNYHGVLEQRCFNFSKDKLR